MSDRTKHQPRLVMPLSFPTTRDVLWDHTPQGDSFRLTATEGRCIRVRLAEQALVLSADCAIDVPRQCCLYGRASVRADGQEVLLDISHFDSSHGSNSQDGELAPPPVPSSLTVPLTVSKLASRLRDDELRMHMETSLLLLRSRATAHRPVDIADFLSLRAYAYFRALPSSGTSEAEVTFDLVVHDSAFHVTPVAAVPVADTALSVSLIRDRNVLGGDAARSGFLTMDQTRKLVFMLESDPKAFTLPLVGLWVKGIDVVTHPYVWAACMRYLFDAAIGDRACGAPRTGRQAFLLILIPPAASSRPRFFDCTLSESVSDRHLASGAVGVAKSEQQLVYRLLSSTMGHSVSKGRGLGPTRAALSLDLCPVSDGPRSAPFAAAIAASALPSGAPSVEPIALNDRRRRAAAACTAVEPARTLSSLSRTQHTDGNDDEEKSEDEDTVPRASPSPHLRKLITCTIAPAVPDVSLLFDDSLLSPFEVVDTRSSPATSKPLAAEARSDSPAVSLKPGSLQETACPSSWQQPAMQCLNTNGFFPVSMSSKRVAFNLPKGGQDEQIAVPATVRGGRLVFDDGKVRERAILGQELLDPQQQQAFSRGCSSQPASGGHPSCAATALPKPFPGDRKTSDAEAISRKEGSPGSRATAAAVAYRSALQSAVSTSNHEDGELARRAESRHVPAVSAASQSVTGDLEQTKVPVLATESWSCDAGDIPSATSPDVYELLRRQDEQLRALQDQIGRLLRSQRPISDLTAPVCGGKKPAHRDARGSGAAPKLSPPQQRAVSPIESHQRTVGPAVNGGGAELKLVTGASDAGGTDRFTTSSRPYGIATMARDDERSLAGVTTADARPTRCSVAVNTGTSLYCDERSSPAPSAGQLVSRRGDVRDCNISGEYEAGSDDGCDLDSLSAVSGLQVPTQASFASSSPIVLDMPSYASTSYRSRVASEGEHSDSSSSSSNRIANNNSQQMAATRRDPLSSPAVRQQPPPSSLRMLCPDKEPEVADGADYYSALIKNVRHLLARHEVIDTTTAAVTKLPPRSSALPHEDQLSDSGTRVNSLGSARAAASEAVTADDTPSPTDATTAAVLPCGQLSQSLAAVAAADATPTTAWSRVGQGSDRLLRPPDDAPSALVSALLPRAEYESLFFSADDDDEVQLSPDKSMEVNALALKYLGDQQLTRLSRLAGAAAPSTALATPAAAALARPARRLAAISPALLLQAVLPQTCSAGSGSSSLSLLDSSAASASTWMSFASTKYLRRHGLLGLPDNGGLSVPRAPSPVAASRSAPSKEQQLIIAATTANAQPTVVAVRDTASSQKCNSDNMSPEAGKRCSDTVPDGKTIDGLLRTHPRSCHRDVPVSDGSSRKLLPFPGKDAASLNPDVQVLAGIAKAPRRLRSQKPLATIDLNRPAAEASDRWHVAASAPVKVLDMDRLRELPKLL